MREEDLLFLVEITSLMVVSFEPGIDNRKRKQ